MLLVFFVIFLFSETLEENLGYKYTYTLEINPLPFVTGGGHAPEFFLPIPGINFEMKVKDGISLNFELNNVWFIFPVEAEIGIREYLGRESFRGTYLYQGLAWGWINIATSAESEENSEKNRYRKLAKYVPNLILTLGNKSISKKGFTIDPFLGLRIIYGGGFLMGNLSFGSFKFGILPALGLYLGYSW
jgi:hypothetical protein